jgi:hypothetical protein
VDQYIRELNGACVFQTQFSAQLNKARLTFTKQNQEEVEVRFYQLNPFDFNKEQDYSMFVPHFQFKTKENAFAIPDNI